MNGNDGCPDTVLTLTGGDCFLRCLQCARECSHQIASCNEPVKSVEPVKVTHRRSYLLGSRWSRNAAGTVWLLARVPSGPMAICGHSCGRDALLPAEEWPEVEPLPGESGLELRYSPLVDPSWPLVEACQHYGFRFRVLGCRHKSL